MLPGCTNTSWSTNSDKNKYELACNTGLKLSRVWILSQTRKYFKPRYCMCFLASTSDYSLDFLFVQRSTTGPALVKGKKIRNMLWGSGADFILSQTVEKKSKYQEDKRTEDRSLSNQQVKTFVFGKWQKRIFYQYFYHECSFICTLKS